MNKRVCLKTPMAIVISAVALMSTPAFSQQTTSSVRGVVADESGRPLSNSTVIIRNEETGLTRSVETTASGEFAVRNLPVGENYKVTVSASGYAGEVVEGLPLNLGETANLNFDLASTAGIEEVTVVGVPTVASQVAVGPSTTFGLAELESAPSINRNIADVMRADPRIYVDESRGDINSVSCAGQNPRYNSLTVDGVRMNDSFGLNSNGYPTERMPFSYDAIQQVAVELAPFDVQYGGFTACNINAVTKSGGNEFHGGVFYDYTSDSFRGDSLEGDDIQLNDYDEKRYGFNVGGPIIQDQLYFFAAYEKLEGANLFNRGPQGSGAVNEILVTQEELDEIAEIARDVYGYEVGDIPNAVPNEDEKLLLKLDWNIFDNQRLAYTYNWNDGFNITESDGESSEFEFSDHLYERGAELTSHTFNLYSDWSYNFSTEMRVAHLDLDNRQISQAGTEFGEIRVELDNVDVYLGQDDSRQANKLDYDVLSLAFKGEYVVGEHTLSFGVEREDLEIFNMFVQHVDTELRFNGIDDFRNGIADDVYYNNNLSGDPADAAANFGYAINTVYFQDEFQVGDNLTVVAGLRYDWYTSSDRPAENADFVAEYGFSNTNTVDGEGLLQPRLAVTYDYSDLTTFRAGLGLYSGGNPNVWLSNSYSNTNVTQNAAYVADYDLFGAGVTYSGCEEGVPNGPGWCVPTELFDTVAAGENSGGLFDVNYLDPDFELPSEWKLSLGATHLADFGGDGIFGGEYLFTADLLFTEGKDSMRVIRGDLVQTGTDAQGYPTYDQGDVTALVLTNSDVGNESFNAAFSVAKSYDNGVDWTFGYAYSDAEDVQPMTSAVAFSNYQERAFTDPQEDVLSTSSFNIEHRFVATLNWRNYWFGDNETTISLYAHYNQGVPYSYVYDDGNAIYGYSPYLDLPNVLPPGEERNSHEGSWWGKVDFRVEQEFPGFRPDDKASAFLVIDNLTNFLDDDLGVLYEANYPNTAVVGSGIAPEARVGDASLYEIRFGVKYDF